MEKENNKDANLKIAGKGEDTNKPLPEKLLTMADVPLGPNEDIRIVVVKKSNGEVSTSVMSREEGKPTFNFFEAVGILEAAKSEALLQNRGGGRQEAAAPQQPADQEMILDEIDLEMDITGQMDQMGLKPGAKLMVTKNELDMRNTVRKAFLAKKEEVK